MLTAMSADMLGWNIHQLSSGDEDCESIMLVQFMLVASIVALLPYICVNAFCLQVPRSSNHITEDSDYTLFSVCLFRRVVDSFKNEARQKGYQVMF